MSEYHNHITFWRVVKCKTFMYFWNLWYLVFQCLTVGHGQYRCKMEKSLTIFTCTWTFPLLHSLWLYCLVTQLLHDSHPLHALSTNGNAKENLIITWLFFHRKLQTSNPCWHRKFWSMLGTVVKCLSERTKNEKCIGGSTMHTPRKKNWLVYDSFDWRSYEMVIFKSEELK